MTGSIITGARKTEGIIARWPRWKCLSRDQKWLRLLDYPHSRSASERRAQGIASALSFKKVAAALLDAFNRLRVHRAHRASLFSPHYSPDKAVLDDDIRGTPQNPKRNHRTEVTVVTEECFRRQSLICCWLLDLLNSRGGSERKARV